MKTLPIVLLVVAVVLIAAVDASNDTLTVAAQTLGSAPATISGKASRRGSSIAAYRGNVPLPVNIKSPVPPSLKDDAVAAATAALGTLSSPPQDTAGISLAGTNEAVASSGNAVPASICGSDPPLFTTGAKQQVCTAFINAATGGTFACTAWFVGSRHVATAGHCVAPGGKRTYHVNTRSPGFVCCKFVNGACAAGSAWPISRWVSTNGWVNNGNFQNDGAVLKVNPPSTTGCVNGGVVQRWGYWPKTSNVPAQIASIAGFPQNDGRMVGCVNLASRTMYGSVANVAPLNSPTTDGLVVQLPFSGCGGISGGVVMYEPTNAAWGIISTASVGCSNSRSFIGVVQITDGTTSGGVNMAAMIRAIP